MGFAPGLFEGGGGEVATVAAGYHGPEMEAVGVVDFVESDGVDGGFLFVGVDAFGYEAEAAGRGECWSGRIGFWEKWFVALW